MKRVEKVKMNNLSRVAVEILNLTPKRIHFNELTKI